MLEILFWFVIRQKAVMKNQSLFILLSLTSIFVSARTIEKTVAVVDDEMIFLSEVKAYQKLLSSSLAPAGILFQLRPKKELIRSRKKLIDFMIDEKVLKLQLPEEHLETPSKEEIVRQELKKKNISNKSLKKKLQKIGLSLERYQDILYYNNLFERWIQTEIASTTQVLDVDINDYHRMKTGKNFFKQYRYSLNQWKFKFNEEGKVKAEKFSQKMEKKNTPFQAISLTEEQMNNDLKKVISEMSVGQFSKPICFGSHCYVFELLQKSFLISDQSKTERLRAKIFQEKFSSRFKSWMQDKRKASIIKKYT